MRTRSLIRSALFVTLPTLAAGAPALAAPRTERGMTLVVPGEHASMGTVYYALPGKDAQTTFTSDAPLEFFKATSNRVVGYLVVKASDAGPEVAAGEFRLPLDSFDTGLSMRNEHMKEPRWMDAKSHPDVVFTVKGFTGAKPGKEGEGSKSWTGALVGTMAVKGVEKPIEIPATLTMWAESPKTKGRAPGDLLAIRADYSVKLSDYGIGVGDPGMQSGKMSDVIGLETRLFLSTVSPEAPRPQRPQGEAGGAKPDGQAKPDSGAKPDGAAAPKP